MDNERRSSLVAEFRSLTKGQQEVAIDEILSVLNDAMTDPKAVILRRSNKAVVLTLIIIGNRP
jgi:hypothetical protein